MNTSTAKFVCSAPDYASCPDESLPEFAFAGRSNVGKSSLINLVVGRDGLARVSPTPGHTRHLNFYDIGARWRLVDMPGHGYAKVERKERGRFSQAVLEYLDQRPNLECVFVLVDSSIPPQANDLEFLEWLVDHEVPFVLVLTKTDKVRPAELRGNIEAFRARIAEWSDTPPEVLTCSSVSGDGRKALLALVESVVGPDRSTPAGGRPPKRDTPW